jgi:16S rRNA C967 or C1407 C5-methylase (RsmB/RsmF family)/NOL1/NOP2/fmu family ribosome biogenesis protein
LDNSVQVPPSDFLNKIKSLLPDEYAAFEGSYQYEPHVGLRVNDLKIRAGDFLAIVPFAITPVGSHEPSGFLVTDASKPGQHAYHAAGLYYLQEPSAMVVGGLVDPQPGELVLDLAAAPGGKATHLAARMAGEGLLVANDISASRAAILAQNLERWGAKNCLITNSTPERLVDKLGAIFDRVLVDAPCSGEGMFRRVGVFEWGEEIVEACARRQTAVLDTAAQLVRPGGRLVYATCTFSPEENEQIIAAFLIQHPDFAMAAVPAIEGADAGRPLWTTPAQQAQFDMATLSNAIRLWPHRFPGEGHFVAVMQRAKTGEKVEASIPWEWTLPRQQELIHWHAFERIVLQQPLPVKRLLLVKDRLYLLPERTIDVAGVKLVRYGLLLGEMRRGYFKPAHTLALALRKEQVTAVVDWSADSPEIGRYLVGYDFPAEGINGWVLVTVDGFAIGWGKRVNGRLKNHYPKGLRIKKA